MKKTLFLICFCICASYANAQLITTKELEAYAIDKYHVDKGKWEKRAQELMESGEVALDKNNSIQWSEVIDCGKATKAQLYVLVNYWFTQTFNDANSVIKLNDKELGTIIASGYVPDVAEHGGGMNQYMVSLKPIIKADIKDGKIRLTYTLQAFVVTKAHGAGAVNKLFGSGKTEKVTTSNWDISKCYPFMEKPENKAPKATSKGLLMGCAYSFVLMDKFKEAVQNGIDGNENADW